jgi:ABC-2 type transport system permease protein
MHQRINNFFFLVKREFGLFWSNKIFVVAFLIMPVILAFLLGNVYMDGAVKHLKIVVVDKDKTPMSNKLIDMFAEHQTLHVLTVKHEAIDLDQTMLDTRAVAIVVIPERFESDVFNKHRPEVNTYLNMSNTVAAGAVGTAIAQCNGTLNAGIGIEAMKKAGLPATIAAQRLQPFQLNLFQLYNPGQSYLVFLWPALIFSILHQLLLLAMAVSFSQEIENNTFNQAGILGRTTSAIQLIIVKMFPYLMLSMVTLLVFYLFSLHFKLPHPVNPGVLFLSQILMVISTCLLGGLYSLIFPSQLKATELLLCIASPAFTVSGFTWPADQAPAILEWFGKIIPLTPYLKSLRALLLEGANFHDVMPFIQHQLILIAVYFLLSFILLKLKIRKSLRAPKQAKTEE